MTEQFIRGSDNQIRIQLTEDDVAISGAWTVLDIWVGTVNIHRTADGDGVTLDTSTGILTINPGDLTTAEKTALGGLDRETLHRGQIVVTSALNDDGVVFGGPGAERLNFYVSDKPA